MTQNLQQMRKIHSNYDVTKRKSILGGVIYYPGTLKKGTIVPSD